jgi:serine/threonine protein kinase
MPYNFKKLLKRDNFSGHINYSSPELIQEKSYFGPKVDVWSFGCCLYYMLTKKDPFEGKQTYDTKYNIQNN